MAWVHIHLCKEENNPRFAAAAQEVLVRLVVDARASVPLPLPVAIPTSLAAVAVNRCKGETERNDPIAVAVPRWRNDPRLAAPVVPPVQRQLLSFRESGNASAVSALKTKIDSIFASDVVFAKNRH
jgi:hypothetical protein